MKNLTLSLSNRVKKSRYVSLGKQPKVDCVFYAGFELCLPSYFIDRKNFPFWIIEYIADGHGEITIGGEGCPLRPGSIICYGPGVPIFFKNDPNSPFHKYFLCRTDEDFPACWKQSGLEPGVVLELSVNAPFTEVLDQLLYDGEQGTTENNKVLDAIELILLSYIRSTQRMVDEKESGAAKVYDLTMQVMLKEFRDINSLAELAERTGYGSEYLCRIFRKFHSESPYQALQRMKMNEAFRLLKEGRIRVMDIALKVGFEDPLHFSRVFRKTMGFPPSAVNDR